MLQIIKWNSLLCKSLLSSSNLFCLLACLSLFHLEEEERDSKRKKSIFDDKNSYLELKWFLKGNANLCLMLVGNGKGMEKVILIIVMALNYN